MGLAQVTRPKPCKLVDDDDYDDDGDDEGENKILRF